MTFLPESLFLIARATSVSAGHDALRYGNTEIKVAVEARFALNTHRHHRSS